MDPQVVLLGDDDTLDGLPGFQQGFLNVARVPLDLADDGVAGPAALEFDNQEPSGPC